MPRPSIFTVHPRVTPRQLSAALAAERALGDAARPVCSVPGVQTFVVGRVHGPIEARVRWVDDDEAPDPGDYDDAAFWESVATYGVAGCIIETRAAALLHPDAPAPRWETATSLWSIIGDADYHREIERELLREV